MISSKVAVTIFILVSVVGTGALAITLDYQQVARRKEFRSSTLRSLELLAAAVTPAIANGRHDTIQNIVDNASSVPEKLTEIQSLEVVDRYGRVLADLDPRRYNMQSDSAGLHKSMALRASKLQALSGHMLEAIIPIRITYPLGVIRARVSEAHVIENLKTYQHQAGGLILGTSLVLAIALYLVLRRLVAHRLVDLAHTATSFRQGRMDVLASASGNDEIALLGESFNRMAESIRAYTEELEKRVTERTAELRRANEQLERLAVTDGLTNLFNRRHFEERAKRDLELARRENQRFAITMMDVDQFKQLNDRFGHKVGDDVLRLVGRILNESARTTDIAARVGGEEFILAMPQTDLEEAVHVAERIRESIERKIVAEVTSLGTHVVTASFGVAAFPEDGETLSDLVSAADVALYQAKRTGRNRVERAGLCAGKMEALG